MNGLEFQYPWALGTLLLVPVLFRLKENTLPAAGFAAAALLKDRLRPSWFKKWGPDAAASLFFACAVLAVANPRYASHWKETVMESRWIMLTQDLSGSMNRPGGNHGEKTLGDVTLDGAEAFVNMRGKDDLIGIVAFSSYAKLVCPPTFDREILLEKLRLLRRQSDSKIFRDLTAGGATNASYAAWIALSAFFMLLPEKSRLSFDEIAEFRHSLLGATQKDVRIPDKLKSGEFGRGMALVLFTDGRIEANKTDEDVRKGLPNFVNVIGLVGKLGIKIYLIVVGDDVNPEVKSAIEKPGKENPVGRIFYMPRMFSSEKIENVYRKIDEMEKNRLLVRITRKQKETRGAFSAAAFALLAFYLFMKTSPGFKRV